MDEQDQPQLSLPELLSAKQLRKLGRFIFGQLDGKRSSTIKAPSEVSTQDLHTHIQQIIEQNEETLGDRTVETITADQLPAIQDKINEDSINGREETDTVYILDTRTLENKPEYMNDKQLFAMNVITKNRTTFVILPVNYDSSVQPRLFQRALTHYTDNHIIRLNDTTLS